MSVERLIPLVKSLEKEDIAVLMAVEEGMTSFEYVPLEQVVRLSRLDPQEVEYRLGRLEENRLLRRWIGHYVGYALNYAGYDCLALDALVKRGVVEALGKPLGVGKEADVYDALTPSGERVAVKFHRLGRISFRGVRRVRHYLAWKRHAPWLYRSRVAAEREYRALCLLHPKGISVPRPVGQNRHVVVMGYISGALLAEAIDLPNPRKVLKKVLENVRRAFLDAGVIHADLSEFNIVVDGESVLIIDWPQFVTPTYPSAERLLKRDVKNVINYFKRKHRVVVSLEQALAYVKGERSSLSLRVDRRAGGE